MITVHLPSGAASTQVMWVDADDDHLIMNTEVHRAKHKALQADPRATVTVWQLDDPYHYAEVRGRLESTETGPEALAMINRLSQKYTGHDYTNPIQKRACDAADRCRAPAVPLTRTGFWRGSSRRCDVAVRDPRRGPGLWLLGAWVGRVS